MEIKDFLDRFEILYQDNTRLQDYRRAYNDKDLSSIFRIVDYDDLRKAVMEKNIHSIFRVLDEVNIKDITIDFDNFKKAVSDQNLYSIFKFTGALDEASEFMMDDIRKAVIDKNLNSIFRLAEPDDPTIADFRKLILENNIWSMWKILLDQTGSFFIPPFKFFKSNGIEIDYDCFSRGQLKSKIWLINELKKLDLNLGTVFLCAGWYATLSVMMFEENIRLDKVRSFDIDPSCKDIAERFNKKFEIDNWKFKAITYDIHDIDYHKPMYPVIKPDGEEIILRDAPDTIINTSCEHIKDFEKWYSLLPKSRLLILQTNNYSNIEDHVNCSEDLDDFKFKTPMSNCLYEGELDLGPYKRFMRIGYR